MKYFATACRLSLLMLLFNALSTQGLAQDQVRQWTSRETSQTIEASFQSYDPKSRQVSLQLPDGETLSVHLRQLSRPDQRYVTKVAKKKIVEPQVANEGAADVVEPDADSRTKALENSKKKSSKTRAAFGIFWTPDLQSALKSAAGNETPDDDRPVAWLRVLGDLDGFM
jgi:hypothetical protein